MLMTRYSARNAPLFEPVDARLAPAAAARSRAIAISYPGQCADRVDEKKGKNRDTVNIAKCTCSSKEGIVPAACPSYQSTRGHDRPKRSSGRRGGRLFVGMEIDKALPSRPP